MLPPVTGEPVCFSTGSDSPVSMLSSTLEAPSSTVPSTGIAAPGRTRTTSPTADFIERDRHLNTVFDDDCLFAGGGS